MRSAIVHAWQHMIIRLASSTIEIETPAKVNLFLEILGRRSDGYHEIETLMAPIRLYDTVNVSSRSDQQILFECKWAEGWDRFWNPISDDVESQANLQILPTAENNLAYKAAKLLSNRFQVRDGATVRLVKRIPAAAGLGGASSDAAATLVALAMLWKLELSSEALRELGAELGSDVPFFMSGSPAICRGRGEKIEPIARFPTQHLVLVRPEFGLSTPSVYRHVELSSERQELSPRLRSWRAGDSRHANVGAVNRLENAARKVEPRISTVRQSLLEAGCLAAQMTGSGSCCFGIANSARHARRIVGRLRSRHSGAVLATQTC